MALRPGIAAVFKNNEGKVLIFERSDRPGIWQFPQGGLEVGESHEEAFRREMHEEIGVEKFRTLRKSAGTTNYYWPPETLQKRKNHFVGQEHTWFLAELEQENPDLEKGDGSFTRFEWVPVQEALRRNLEWKRPSMGEGLRQLGLL